MYVLDMRIDAYFTMQHHKLSSGINAMLQMTKDIEESTITKKKSNVVKLRFTRKQYESFRDACKMLELISGHPDFTDFVQTSLGGDTKIKVSTISKQLVTPIVEAPLKIAVKVPTSASANKSTTQKESYFVLSTPMLDGCKKLYEATKDALDTDELKKDPKSETTCITDVRIMMSKYISVQNLRTKDGVIIDELLQTIASNAISKHKSDLIDGTIIPKSNRTIMTSIINEITFGV